MGTPVKFFDYSISRVEMHVNKKPPFGDSLPILSPPIPRDKRLCTNPRRRRSYLRRGGE